MIPRWYQSEAHDAFWNYLRTKSGNPVIVLPTGAGKSLVIAMIVEQARKWDARILVLAHRKELLQQNAEKIRTLLPNQPVGLHSAGLRRHSFDDDVICCGIQSVYRKAAEFGRRELILIDEVHLVPSRDEGMYRKFITEMQQFNTKLRLGGLTATPYRTGEGPLCGPDRLFQRICYEVPTSKLIDEGYLCLLTNKPAESTIDTSEIKKRGGEFIAGEAERAFDDAEITEAACREIIASTHNRNSVLIFASGVQHAEHIRDVMECHGHEAGLVTGDTFAMERKNTLSRFRNGKLRYLINCDVLTTGFDAPRIDAIAILRATMSPGLFAQIVGRGLRQHEDKQDCLVLDFGENIKRHGSLDDPQYGRASLRDLQNGDADKNGRGKECPNCELDCAVQTRTCPDCGFQFPFEAGPRHGDQADGESQIIGAPQPREWLVEEIYWCRHEKRGNPDAPPTLRINYVCREEGSDGNLGTITIKEWVCIEHDGFAKRKAQAWWDARSLAPFPGTVQWALRMLDDGFCRHPNKLTTTKEGAFHRIQQVQFVDEKPTEVDVELEMHEVEVDGFGEEVPF